jgi:hypothetical protein
VITPLRKFAGSALIGLMALATAPMASAAIVTGSWDPPLPNPPFIGLGWMTTVNVEIPGSCVRADGSTPRIRYVSVLGQGFDCGPSQGSGEGVTPANFSILSAQIGIYSLSTALLVDVLTLDPRSFTPQFVELGSDGFTELAAGDSNAVRGTAGRPVADFEFILGLPGSAPVIRYMGPTDSGFTTATAVPQLIAYSVDYDSSALTVITRTELQIGDRVPGLEIPEPGSFVLALLALGMAGGVASRRGRQRR